VKGDDAAWKLIQRSPVSGRRTSLQRGKRREHDAEIHPADPFGDAPGAFVAALCRGISTVGPERPNTPDTLKMSVLDFWNARLAERITQGADQNVFLLYGSSHFPGLLKELRARTPTWRVTKVT